MPRKLPTKTVLHPDDPIREAQHAAELAVLYGTPDPGDNGPTGWEDLDNDREDPILNMELLAMLIADEISMKTINALMDAREYPQAIGQLKPCVKMVVGPDYEVPLYSKEGGGVWSQKYANMAIRAQVLLMRYSNLLGKAFAAMGKDEEALNWFNEVEVVHKNAVWGRKQPVFDWIDVHYNIQEYTEQRFIAFKGAADVFWKLGNTSAVSHRLYKIEWLLRVIPRQLSFISQNLAHYADKEKGTKARLLRHPDPSLCAKLEIKNPDLQMLGSWQKVTLAKNTVLQARFHFASFVWKRRFYVLGGEKDWKGPFYRDFWYLDLEKMDTWRPLPECPFPDGDREYGIVSGWQMRVYKNRAYLFTGKKEVPYFDLETEKWGSINTTWDYKTGYPRGMRMFHDYAMEIVDGKMYVFGGAHAVCTLGCNLFMVLDIEKRTWRKLSGYPGPHQVAEPTVPGPRRLTVSWLHKKFPEKIWFLFGEAERIGAKMSGEEHGSTRPYAYDDLWTWDTKQESWRRERFSGNAPCQRTEPAVLYHEKLDKVILFGGSNSALPTMNPDKKSAFEFTYFADTFVLDQSPTASPVTGPRWKHVLTRGFPTYRAQAKMFSDPETGNIYLFAGYTSVKFIPPRDDPFAEDSRAFGDLWQLKLDLPGGHFEGVNLEEEARTARLGPWQRCYSCGSAGPWKKCGGTCRGKAFFCDNECLKEGWREHKRVHGCTKK